MNLIQPNGINCFECGQTTLIDGATRDTPCPTCNDNGDDPYVHEVCFALPCPNGGSCKSDFCNHRGEHTIPAEDAPEAVAGVDYPIEAQPSGKLPDVCARPCSECPWRESSAAGWLGPYDAETWVELAHSDEAIACHTTIEVDEEWTPKTRQCAGAASYRKSQAKRSRNEEVAYGPVHPGVFTRRQQFLDHHSKVGAS